MSRAPDLPLGAARSHGLRLGSEGASNSETPRDAPTWRNLVAAGITWVGSLSTSARYPPRYTAWAAARNGTAVSRILDDLDRLIGRDITPGTGVGGDTDEDFVYDALGRLTEAADDDSIVQMTYDSLSRVLTEVQGSNPLGTTGKSVSFTWDAESNRTKVDYPSGFDANETRDVLGRLTEIEDASSNTVAAFDHYGPGLREKKRTLANGTYTDVAYDGFRRPTDIDHKSSGGTRFAGFAYAWDSSDNPLMEARSHKSGKGDVYSYDKANRLTKVLRDVDDPAAEVVAEGTEAYVTMLEYDMDDVLNLTAYKVTPYGGSTTTTSFTTNAMNEYTAVGGVTHTYTDAGSLADDNTKLYTYDAHEHLIEVRNKATNAVIATYTYDALGRGRRIGKVVGNDTTRYVHAGVQAIEEYDGTGSGANLRRLYVFGERVDQVVAMEAPDAADVDQDQNTTEVLRFSFHTQLIGSVTQVTAPSGSVVESYEYDPYGKPTIKDGSGTTISASAIGNSYLFTARQLDAETGLYYYRARHYSPELRRFIQRDPLEYVDGPNALGYVSASPLVRRDPFGLEDGEFSNVAEGEDDEPLTAEETYRAMLLTLNPRDPKSWWRVIASTPPNLNKSGGCVPWHHSIPPIQSGPSVVSVPGRWDAELVGQGARAIKFYLSMAKSALANGDVDLAERYLKAAEALLPPRK